MMQTFELLELLSTQEEQQELYLEFLRVPDLSVGIYTLPAGSQDPQQPHDEDEVYYVISGQATIYVDGVERNVQPGSIIYVPADTIHYFHEISEDLTTLVFFAPAESK